MSLAYVIMCDYGDRCNETAWASPTMQGYRLALRKQGWSSAIELERKDFCPKHTKERQEEAARDGHVDPGH